MFTIDGLYRLPPPGAMILPMSHNMTCHYSFDMAQQVNINHTYLTMIMTPLGPLPIQPAATRAHLLPYTKEVCHIWGQL